MLINILKFISVALGLAMSNFIYQAFTGKHWDVAIERSFFQAIACLTCAFIA